MNKLQPYPDEQVLLKRIAQGDLAAYRKLFDTYFPDLCNFLLMYLHNQSFAEEIALEIFTQIWEKRESLEVHTSMRGYLFTSAKNRAISFYRREKQKLLSNLDIEEDQISVDFSSQFFLETQELRQIIEEAIESLPEKSRQIYRLAWEENFSHREIAEKLGITAKTVENHVGIALRKLRSSLLPHYKQLFMLWLIVRGII
ncbi:RNA polymerase sigma-70 factor [Gaoshiqia sediminis]|uniref:RNA polymerase sigma-70 factor n=1 Tax=Gaoshiqia sediminis TaxID=2986998 RepID=A0AA41Y4G2_9BACT|nr:RNA polymerase sigma-70 factor [Gaoshiqia sediminis]MCW0483291.1 RNA polymerase sigma-70 factor [Gaoshiqia sediminis]